MTYPVTIQTPSEILDIHEQVPEGSPDLNDSHGNSVVVINRPHQTLAAAVLNNAARNIVNCPKSLKKYSERTTVAARTRVKRALEALYWAENKDEMFVFWCDVADIGVDWLSERIKEMAAKNPLLMEARTFDKARPERRRASQRKYYKKWRTNARKSR